MGERHQLRLNSLSTVCFIFLFFFCSKADFNVCGTSAAAREMGHMATVPVPCALFFLLFFFFFFWFFLSDFFFSGFHLFLFL
jgi:hypothetical protein